MISFLVAFCVAAVFVMLSGRLQPIMRNRGDINAVQASHTAEVLRFGGVATLSGVWAGAIALSWQFDSFYSLILLVSALPIVVVGMAEDSGILMSPKVRFFVAMFSAGIAVWTLGLWVPRSDIPLLEPLFRFSPLAILVSVFFAGGFCHAVNLIDGMNGLAALIITSASAGVGVIALQTSLPEISSLAFILAVSTAAFAVFNWPKSRIFLGDAGAYGLGHILVWLAVSVVSLSPTASVPSLLLVLFWPLADTLHTMMRRFIQKMGIFQPDRMHLHQKVRRCLEIIVVGRKRRNISNPLTTFIMAPFIVVPVVLGVILVNRTGAGWIALMACFLAFSYSHVFVTRLSKLARIRSRIGDFSQTPFGDAQLDYYEATLHPVRIQSSLSGVFVENGISLDIQIFRLSDQKVWQMEILDGEIVVYSWSELFQSEKEAWDEFLRYSKAVESGNSV